MTIEELQEIAKIEKDRQSGFRHRVNVCVAAGCLSCQSGLVKDALAKEVTRRGLESSCEIKPVGCLGLCTAGPLIQVEPEGRYYESVSVGDASDIIESLGGAPVSRLEFAAHLPFFPAPAQSGNGKLRQDRP